MQANALIQDLVAINNPGRHPPLSVEVSIELDDGTIVVGRITKVTERSSTLTLHALS